LRTLRANQDQLQILKQGVEVWNAWRSEHPHTKVDVDLSGVELRDTIDLSGAMLNRADLRGANLNGATLKGINLYRANVSDGYFSGADLFEANLYDAILSRADFSGAQLMAANLRYGFLLNTNLSGANLYQASLTSANLSDANLSRANVCFANLFDAKLIRANLSEADLTGAICSGADLTDAVLRNTNLEQATLVETDLSGADLEGCRVFGISAWGLTLDGANQTNVRITPELESAVTVDDLEVAQFIYLMLNNQKVRNVINTITSKAVLILGRFTPERKAVLDEIREELRKSNYLPILFDFDLPADRDITETVTLLARMARFIIADLTEASSIPKELEAIVPTLAVPVQPLLEGAASPYSMFKDYWKYDWILAVHRYHRLDDLIGSLAEKVVAPAEGKARELERRRNEAMA
jgi:uncharacterized protein YjbI with pentapeptide repeats